VLDLIHDGHYATVSKDRTGLFAGDPKPITVETGKKLAAWLSDGEPVKQPTLVETIEGTIATAADGTYLDRLVGRIDKLADEGRLTSDQVRQLTSRIDSRREHVSPAQPVGSAV
jgi:hypothetical protein